MRNPIPSPRPSDDVRPIPVLPLPSRHPLHGPACPVCDHPSCRTRRAQRLPLLGGHRSEFAPEHARAAQVQARHRHLVLWFGEATQSFWAVTPHGLVERRDIDALLLAVSPPTPPRSDPAVTRPWARPSAGHVSMPLSQRIRRSNRTGRRSFGRPRLSPGAVRHREHIAP